MGCCLIGETGLVIKCAEILLEKSCNVLAIISNDDMVQNWAKQKGVLAYYTFDLAKEYLQKTEFDYIFNIATYSILPAWLLNKPRQLIINYHEGPLPHYAGPHAPSWAILNKEKNMA